MESFSIKNYPIMLSLAKGSKRPLLLILSYPNEAERLVKAFMEYGIPDCHFAVVTIQNWDHDLSPWPCPSLWKGQAPFGGGADAYLDILLQDILPVIKSKIDAEIPYLAIGGYSLAGLFALYAGYKTNAFSRLASVSGSLWFPAFKNFAMANTLQKSIGRIYLSLGDKEKNAKNESMKTVEQNTSELASFYRSKGFYVTYQINPGNHFQDMEKRMAKAICALLED